jgi:hypothetical protein
MHGYAVITEVCFNNSCSPVESTDEIPTKEIWKMIESILSKVLEGLNICYQ